MKTTHKFSVLALLLLISTAFSPCKAQSDYRIDSWLEWQLLNNPSEDVDMKLWRDFDFSAIWSDSRPYHGYIGEGRYSELDGVSFSKVEKVSPIEYLVEGALIINDKENAFVGCMFVEKISELKEIESELVKDKVKSRGLVIARFYFDTDKKYDDHGMLNGVVISQWYIDMAGNLLYDDLEDNSEYNANNQFVGTFIPYDRDQTLKCAWGQHRVPDIDLQPEVVSIQVVEVDDWGNPVCEAEDAVQEVMAPMGYYDEVCECEEDDEYIYAVEESQKKMIFILDGAAALEMDCRYIDFPCIGIQFSDSKVRARTGTYLEIKRDGDSYLVKVKYDPERFSTIDEGIEAYLKELFASFYKDGGHRKYGKKVWNAFVKEGGLQEFIDMAKKHIDDEFLDVPFNEIYG